VRPYGATIPRGYHFALDDKFIDFLLTKRTFAAMINHNHQNNDENLISLRSSMIDLQW
jgi:hypothetical protein